MSRVEQLAETLLELAREEEQKAMRVVGPGLKGSSGDCLDAYRLHRERASDLRWAREIVLRSEGKVARPFERRVSVATD